MRVFVTGATGYVGTAVVRELLEHSHSVIGLARSESAADVLEQAGVESHYGDLEDLASLADGAAKADAVIHLGFNHDFTKFAESCAQDAEVIRAIGAELSGSDRLFLVTSGTAILPAGTVSTETDLAPSGEIVNPRAATEFACSELTRKGVNVAAVRLAPSVHGQGDHGFVRMLADIAMQNGEAAYVDEGQNRWCAVHRLDAARLYLCADGELVGVQHRVAGATDTGGDAHILGVQHNQIRGLEVIQRIRRGLEQVAPDDAPNLRQELIGPAPVNLVKGHGNTRYKQMGEENATPRLKFTKPLGCSPHFQPTPGCPHPAGPRQLPVRRTSCS
ncbi:NAD-dependent epimerase/dehydratase family protein [Ruegeria jejuensis]|uniref:NAD-dependent epimerase/dehydratase family protein n=1 Tax=Ruegeria jejuensis TaxID=3233338 RepID=UPI00355B22AA